MLITTNGLVTRSYKTGNSDHVIHLLTEDRGRLSVMVKGSNSGKAGNAAAVTQPFTYGNYELYTKPGADLYWFRAGVATSQFFHVTADLTRTSLAAYLCDVATELCPAEDATDETAAVLRMLLNTLYALSETDKPAAIIKSVFELRAAALMGYQPDLTGCTDCGAVYPANAYLDVMNGCLVCADCMTERNRRLGRLREPEDVNDLGERRILCPVSASVLAAMRYALTAPDRKIFSFQIKDREELSDFERAAETYLLNQLEQDFATLRFYRSVEL